MVWQLRPGPTLHRVESLQAWLSKVDAMPLECDGAARVVSALLTREQLAHEVSIGSLAVEGCGEVPLHWWVELPGGIIIDFRARMWLGEHPAVPHGVFIPNCRQQYAAASDRRDVASLSPLGFHVLAETSLDGYPRLGAR